MDIEQSCDEELEDSSEQTTLLKGSTSSRGVDRARRCLYVSHGLSAWAQRMWEFAVGLVILHIYPDSLALVSAAGLVMSLAQVVFGTSVGEYVDRTNRLRAACTMYVLQNFGIAISAACALLLLGTNHSKFVEVCTIITFMIGAGLSEVGALGSTVSVEREWTKVLCAGDSMALASQNAVMKRIDLTCLLLSPIAVGFLMTFVSTPAAVIVLTVWTLMAWMPECCFLAYAQNHAPELRAEKVLAEDRKWVVETPWQQLARGWYTWCTQRCVIPAACLSLMYCTVLSLGVLMTAYLKWQGMNEATLSVARGLGAVSGLAATVVYPKAQAKIGCVQSAAVSIWLQVACLAVAVMPQFIDKINVMSISTGLKDTLLVGGLVVSRFGLWAFDLSVNQLLQEWVEDHNLGVVNSVQGSLQQLCQLAIYVVGVFFGAPEKFVWLMLGSWLVVVLAAVLYTLFALQHNARLTANGGILLDGQPRDGLHSNGHSS